MIEFLEGKNVLLMPVTGDGFCLFELFNLDSIIRMPLVIQMLTLETIAQHIKLLQPELGEKLRIICRSVSKERNLHKVTKALIF